MKNIVFIGFATLGWASAQGVRPAGGRMTGVDPKVDKFQELCAPDRMTLAHGNLGGRSPIPTTVV